MFSLVNGYDNLSRYEVDGTNFETDLAFRELLKEQGKEKDHLSLSLTLSDYYLIHPQMIKKYRKKEDLDKDKNRDPLLVFEKIV